MLQYDFDEFVMWLAQQPGGPGIVSVLTRPQLWYLHNAMDAFRMDVEREHEAINAATAACRARLLAEAAITDDSPARRRYEKMRDGRTAR